MSKKWKMMLLCVCFAVLTVMPVVAAGTDESARWTFDEAAGVLCISGTGSMESFRQNGGYPWASVSGRIREVVIEEGITTVGDGAFVWCQKLQTVRIADTVNEIGENAFWGCTELQSVILPEHVTEIGSGAFFLCKSLTEITVPAGVTQLAEGVFAQCESLETVTLHDEITVIEKDAFSRCYGLKHLTLPGSLEGIGYHAFFGCVQLQQLTFGNELKCIDNAAFYGCDRLTSLRFMGPAPELGALAFLGLRADVYYSIHEDSWKDTAGKNYGGMITWTAECFHEYAVEFTAPTCEAEGFSTFTCSRCGDRYTDLFIPALGHNFDKGFCTVCGAADDNYLPGDMDLDGDVDVDDVLSLLWYVLFPDDYPIEVDADFDHNGSTDVDDVLTLLWYVLFPEDYPLN